MECGRRVRLGYEGGTWVHRTAPLWTTFFSAWPLPARAGPEAAHRAYPYRMPAKVNLKEERLVGRMTERPAAEPRSAAGAELSDCHAHSRGREDGPVPRNNLFHRPPAPRAHLVLTDTQSAGGVAPPGAQEDHQRSCRAKQRIGAPGEAAAM